MFEDLSGLIALWSFLHQLWQLDFQTQDQSPGPALAKTINLGSFRSQKGHSLAEAIKRRSLAMIVLVPQSPN
ncbi:MAG TPA: hypothetical protein VI031_05045 [Pyrinomonadaceae bacterium]